MTSIVERMMDLENGVRVSKRSVKIFRNNIQRVFTKKDATMWLKKTLEIDNAEEAEHLCFLIAAHGYFFPSNNYAITLKNDDTYYEFQDIAYWPNSQKVSSDIDYLVYLCKGELVANNSTELTEYESESFGKLKAQFFSKWHEIERRASKEIMYEKNMDLRRRQERAFWNVHRPKFSHINVFEDDIFKKTVEQKKLKCNQQDSISSKTTKNRTALDETAQSFHVRIENLRQKLDRFRLKKSKVCESLVFYVKYQSQIDPMMIGEQHFDPWTTEIPNFSLNNKEEIVTSKQAKSWGLSFDVLLHDKNGCSEFRKFLEKEFSAENLDFFLECNKLKEQPLSQVRVTVKNIYDKFLSDNALNPINIGFGIKNATIKNMESPTRFCFEEAQMHIYRLMKNDSYVRFLVSDQYQKILRPYIESLSSFTVAF